MVGGQKMLIDHDCIWFLVVYLQGLQLVTSKVF